MFPLHLSCTLTIETSARITATETFGPVPVRLRFSPTASPAISHCLTVASKTLKTRKTYQSHCKIIDSAQSSTYLALIRQTFVMNTASRTHARQRLILRDHLTAPRAASPNKTLTTLVYRFMNGLYCRRTIFLRRIYQAAFFIARDIRLAVLAAFSASCDIYAFEVHYICIASVFSSIRRGISMYNSLSCRPTFAGVLSFLA